MRSLRPLLATVLLAAAHALASPAPAAAAFGTPVIDGVKDAVWGAPIATDPVGDMTEPNLDLGGLYLLEDAENFYIGFDAYASTWGMTYGVYVDTDLVEGSGATADPWGRAVDAAAARRPEYALYVYHDGADAIGDVQLDRWQGYWDYPSLASLGGAQAYGADNDWIEYRVPKAAIGSPSRIAVEVFTTGGSGHAQDTVPSDANVAFTSPDWGGATTTLTAFQLFGGGPTVTSVTRADPDPTAAASVRFTVAFSEAVSGVDAADFTVATAGGVSGASVTGVTPESGPADTYSVTVGTGTGSGTLGLDVNASGTGITNGDGAPLAGGYDAGEAYTVSKTMTFRSVGADDGWVLETGEVTGAGGALDASSAALFVGDDQLRRQYRAILSFDTAALPDSAVVTRAVLQVKRRKTEGVNPFDTHGKLLVELRTGTFSGRRRLQAADFAAPASVAPAAALAKTELAGGWHQAVLKASALPAVNRTGLTQARLRFALDDDGDATADRLSLCSGNHPTLAARPRLVVEYYTPTP